MELLCYPQMGPSLRTFFSAGIYELADDKLCIGYVCSTAHSKKSPLIRRFQDDCSFVFLVGKLSDVFGRKGFLLTCYATFGFGTVIRLVPGCFCCMGLTVTVGWAKISGKSYLEEQLPV